MRWDLDTVIAATSGRLRAATAGGSPVVFPSVATDSRRLEPGALFVPIRGERDGHDFIDAAVQAGAAAYLVEAAHPRTGELPAVTAIEVADTGAALLDLGRAARDRLPVPLVGITGSVGKTSTKDMAAAVLGRRWSVAASPRSFNNELGVPLTLANAAEDAEIAVIEMGARAGGHVAMLCRLARPTVGVVTAVAAVHTEMFGSVEAVAQAKGELVEALPPGGTAVLNGDDRRVSAMADRTDAEVIRYSATGRPGADVVAEDVSVGDDLRPRFRLRSAWGSAELTLGARGAHQVGNALAAAAVGLRSGVPLDDTAAALEEAVLSPWRMELGRTVGGATLLNDAYNANPVSVTAALRALAALPARRRVAVLGGMTELGPEGPEAHRAVAALARDLGIDLLAVGTADYGMPPLPDNDAVVAALADLGPDDAVLIKGSRVIGMERLAHRLAVQR
ncbi:MAG TPA: UDP-N-acetylmuramoyl-tripeptide--D-alanyl-D-alanine ligase [Acidimicrobiales bacterium]|nr:UDP-N-acetylmuramoyl-tripeptide--D-alanyl-D-alanine ligase [Acidimicrobiales bacterium]